MKTAETVRRKSSAGLWVRNWTVLSSRTSIDFRSARPAREPRDVREAWAASTTSWLVTGVPSWNRASPEMRKTQVSGVGFVQLSAIAGRMPNAVSSASGS